jgi:predicted metal-dependent hydrolase
MPEPETGAVTFGATTVPYVIVRSRRRRKTMSITLHPEHGVRVAVPAKTASRLVRTFVQQRAAWIVRKTAEATRRPQRLMFVTGERLPYLGEQLPLYVDEGPVRRVRVALEGESFRVSVPPGLGEEARATAIERGVIDWYRERAQEHLAARAEFWSGHLDCTPTRVLARDQRSRWGSCSADGTLRFNWRLIMADPELIDYVVVHELTHTLVRNHSAAFWAALAKTMPDYRSHRSRLRDFGSQMVL